MRQCISVIAVDDGRVSCTAAAHDPTVQEALCKNMSRRTLQVAAVQMACDLGAICKNLERATSFIEDAARQGAELVLLPELMPGGYTLTQRIWDTAEPFDGTTTRWMSAVCRRLGIYAGTTFLEAEGGDFFNTFVLADPDGKICGWVRKNPAASFEAYFFRSGDTPHWFDTPIGRIGVGICFENALYERYCEIQSADIDLYLRPFSGASFEAKFPVRQRDADMLNAALRDGTAETARLMGIPVVMANKVGRLVTELPAGFPAQDIEFPGFSAIADSDGRCLGQLGTGQEGVVVGMVTLDPSLKCKARVPPAHGQWNAAMPWWAFVWTLTQRLGERSYTRSAERRLRALAVGSRVRGIRRLLRARRLQRQLHARAELREHRQAVAEHSELRHAPAGSRSVGGLILALPGPDEDHNPATAATLAEVLRANPAVPYDKRIEVARFIEDLTASCQCGWYSVISLHGGGSPAAMKQEILRNHPVGSEVEFAERLLDRGVLQDDLRAITRNRQPGRCYDTGCTQPGQAMMVPLTRMTKGT